MDSQYEDYTDINQDENQDEKMKYVNDKLKKLPKHDKLRNVDVEKVMMDFDATSLYPVGMWNEKSVYPEMETGFALNII